MGKDVPVPSASGQVLLTNRGQVLLRSLTSLPHPALTPLLRTAQRMSDFSLNFILSVCALTNVLYRLFTHSQALSALKTLNSEFFAIFDLSDLSQNTHIDTEKMMDYIAFSGLSGKLSQFNANLIVSTCKLLLKNDFSQSNLSILTRNFQIYRLKNSLEVLHNALILKGSCKRLLCSEIHSGVVLIVPNSLYKDCYQGENDGFIELKRVFSGILREFEVNLVVCEGEMEVWMKDLVVNLTVFTVIYRQHVELPLLLCELGEDVCNFRLISSVSIKCVSENMWNFAIIGSDGINNSVLLVPNTPLGDMQQSNIELVLYRWRLWVQGDCKAVPGSCAVEVHLAVKHRNNALVAEWMWETARLAFSTVEKYLQPTGKSKWLQFRASQQTHPTLYEVRAQAEVVTLPLSSATVWEPLSLKYLSLRLTTHQQALLTVQHLLCPVLLTARHG